MEKIKGEVVTIDEKGQIAEDVEESFLIVSLQNPFEFEGEKYEKIDLTGLRNIKAGDMVAVNRKLNKNGNIDFLQEMTLEYAINLAARATNLPIEFYEQLPAPVAMQIKSRVTGFLYGRG